MVKFSIVIPAHDEEDYIRKTLHSIKQQTYQNYEVIVVANGCTDKTEEIVKKKNIQLHSLPLANVSLARNYGANKAQGELLVFLDADTQLTDKTLQKINQEFNGNYSVITTKGKPDNQKYKWAFYLKNSYVSTGLYPSCSGILVCPKQLFHKVGGYPEVKVREHHKLIKKLRKYGKFSCVNTHVINSTRRFQKWSLSKFVFFWSKQFIRDKLNRLEESEYEKIR